MNIPRSSKVIIPCLFLFLLLAACSSNKNEFTIRGQLKNIQQAQFLVYSPDGAIEGIDTIQVKNGKFRYQNQCTQPGTLLLVFPNFSQQPIFVAGGKTLKFQADASHLKETSVTGTADNKLMNKFRKEILHQLPAEEKATAIRFIEENPKSLVAQYLLRRYFIQTDHPDYKDAVRLIKIIQTKQKDNISVERLANELQRMEQSQQGQSLPNFYVKTIAGKTINKASFQDAKMGIITTFVPWNLPSLDCMKTIRNYKKSHRDSIVTLSICLDGNLTRCKQTIERDTINWHVACPPDLLDNTAVRNLSLESIPTFILIKKGRIVYRGNDPQQLEQGLKKY